MRKRVIGILVAAALGYSVFGARGEQPAVAQTAPHAAQVSPPSLPKMSLALEAAIAHVPQARGAVVRGDVLPGGRSAVVAADGEGPSSDWRSSLYRVDDSGKIALLAIGLYHASRPLASTDSAIYVERGAAGAWPSQEEAARGRLRTDALHIDAIDPVTGAARTLYTWTGYTLHLAGELAG